MPRLFLAPLFGTAATAVSAQEAPRVVLQITDVVLANVHADRRGDIHKVVEAHVPIVLANPGSAPKRGARRVEAVDLARTGTPSTLERDPRPAWSVYR